MVLANARLSEKSRRKGERFGALLRPGGRRAGARCWRRPRPTRSACAASARAAVQVCGNLKFDMTPDPDAAGARACSGARRWRAPVVLAAVTREGEETPLLRCLGARWTRRGRCCCWCRAIRSASTRWPRWSRGCGFTLQRRSSWDDAAAGRGRCDADVWLGDSMGEMPLYYAAADVALLGGSFAPLGGQNLIEAAACGCPLVMGPHTFNFARRPSWRWRPARPCAWPTSTQGVARAVALARDPARDEWVQRALAFAAAHRGAAERMAREVLAAAGSAAGLRPARPTWPAGCSPPAGRSASAGPRPGAAAGC